MSASKEIIAADYSKIKLCVRKKSKKANSSDVFRLVGPKAAQVFYNALRVGPRVIMRSIFELLRANIITRVLSAAVLLSIDTVALKRKRISIKQYFINVILALMLLVGGTLGWYLGIDAVARVIAEGVALSIIAGLAGAGIFAVALGALWEKIAGLYIKDDAADMLEICNQVFYELAAKYCLSEKEAREGADNININNMALRNMYASTEREAFAVSLMEPYLQKIAAQRSHQPDTEPSSPL